MAKPTRTSASPSRPTATNTPHLLGDPERPETVIRVQLDIPERLYLHYQEQGEAWGRTAEHEMAERIKRCKTHVSTSPLYFTDDQRRELEAALGHNVNGNPDVVLAQLKNAVTLSVDDINIELPPRVQQRLKSRVFRGETYEGNVKKWVLKALRVEAGMDPR